MLREFSYFLNLWNKLVVLECGFSAFDQTYLMSSDNGMHNSVLNKCPPKSIFQHC